MTKKEEFFEGNFLCPCCQSKILSEIGGYEICTICLWEDDPVQSSDPHFAGGANQQSLVEARKLWQEKFLLGGSKKNSLP